MNGYPKWAARLLVMVAALLSGCTAIAVTGAVVSTAVGVGTSVVGTAVDVTVGTGRAVVSAVSADDDPKSPPARPEVLPAQPTSP